MEVYTRTGEQTSTVKGKAGKSLYQDTTKQLPTVRMGLSVLSDMRRKSYLVTGKNSELSLLPMIDTRYLSQIASLFSSATLVRLAVNGLGDEARYILEHSGTFAAAGDGASLAEVFELAYSELLAHYRCEYVYKNEIAAQLLLERHSLEESALFTEFRVDTSKADVVIVNGTSNVYEIKTELDSFDRLSSQIAAYRKAFDFIHIVTHPSLVDKAIDAVDDLVGIIAMQDDHSLVTVREPKSNKQNAEPVCIFNSLRKEEYAAIVNEEFGFIPDVPNTQFYNECLALFRELTAAKAHDGMVQALRMRWNSARLTRLISYVPNSLRVLSLNSKLRDREIEELHVTLSGCIG